MITQSKTISEKEFQAIVKFFNANVFDYNGIHMMVPLFKFPIYGEIEGETYKIGEEVVYAVIVQSKFDGSYRFQIIHQSYFD